MSEHNDTLNAEVMTEEGEVSFIAAFPHTFVHHPTIEGARERAWSFSRSLGRRTCVYRIEIVKVYDPEPAAPAPEPRSA
jgi:hypothetical protein